MDIREKIGQRLVFGFPGTTIPAEFAALVREYKIGNVILFRYNIESLPQLARLCADIQELVRGATGHDAFITIDQEGGMVTRLPWDAVNVPGSMALAATGKPENAVLAAEITARQLRGVGVNFNLAPDLDVNSNPMNPVIGVRSFGDDPQSVALFGTKAVEGYKNGGMLCCGKHFPGHGDTAVDSHIGLPCIEKTMDELEACELISFRAAIKAGIPAIMSSHILFPNIEPNGVPATMSRTIMHGLLRETLGFDGLILSDCMVMDAIRRHYGTAHGVVEAMRAGVDMVFVSSNADLQRESAAAALAAAESGSIDARELDVSAERILCAKERWIHPAELESAGRAEDFAAAARMAREAVTAVRGKACRASEKTFFCGCADYRMTQASNADPEAKAFPEYMGARFGAKFAVCSKDPDEKEIAELVKCADGAGNIIFSSCNAHLFRGQLALARLRPVVLTLDLQRLLDKVHAVQHRVLDVLQRVEGQNVAVRVGSRNGNVVEKSRLHVARAVEASEVRVLRRRHTTVGTLRTTQTKLGQTNLVAHRNTMTGGVGGDQGSKVHHAEKRSLQELAHSNRTLHADYGFVRENQTTLLHCVYSQTARIQSAQIVKELGLAHGHLLPTDRWNKMELLEVVNMILRELECLQQIQHILQTSEDSKPICNLPSTPLLSLERVLSEKHIERGNIVVASQLPV